MENSQVLLKAGDRVITSKGNFGVIESVRLEIISDKMLKMFYGYAKLKSLQIQHGDVFPNTYFIQGKTIKGINFETTKSYVLNEDFKLVYFVKLGKKSFGIERKHLTKLDQLFPVKVVYNTDPTGHELDESTIIYLPKDFCLFDFHDYAKHSTQSLTKRIRPLLEAKIGRVDYSILKIYAV